MYTLQELYRRRAEMCLGIGETKWYVVTSVSTFMSQEGVIFTITPLEWNFTISPTTILLLNVL